MRVRPDASQRMSAAPALVVFLEAEHRRLQVGLQPRHRVLLGKRVEAAVEAGDDERVAFGAREVIGPRLPQREEVADRHHGGRRDDLGQDARLPQKREAATHPSL
jgi:hypothetical protein